MKIRLKTLMARSEGVFLPESVIEVSSEEAQALITGGYADPVPRPASQQKDEPSAVETAAVHPGNRAVPPESKARRTP
jgi:hypothetical protein